MQFHLLPIRDWNKNVQNVVTFVVELQFHLLPIRDWNTENGKTFNFTRVLQFHLLPIRDWNNAPTTNTTAEIIAISLTPY